MNPPIAPFCCSAIAAFAGHCGWNILGGIGFRVDVAMELMCRAFPTAIAGLTEVLRKVAVWWSCRGVAENLRFFLYARVARRIWPLLYYIKPGANALGSICSGFHLRVIGISDFFPKC